MLRKKQSKFAYMVALLIQYASLRGYEVTLGEAYRMPTATHGHPKSLHKKRLAVDLNLFSPAGRYLKDTKDYEPLGLFWESIGGSWGGRFSDGNHFSLEHGGMK
jgi:hypothetical protein